MSYEPLGQYTRKTRTTLMIVSGLTVVAKAYGVELSSVQGLGQKLEAPVDLLPPVLLTLLLFSAISFLFYVVDDLTNLDTPKGYDANKKKFRADLSEANRKLNHLKKAARDLANGKSMSREQFIERLEIEDDGARDRDYEAYYIEKALMAIDLNKIVDDSRVMWPWVTRVRIVVWEVGFPMAAFLFALLFRFSYWDKL